MIFNIICLAFAFVAFLYAWRCYYELWKWAKQCQNARIVLAYKRKVKKDAPILEWLLWTNLLDKDKDARGHVMYNVGGTTVALIKGFDLQMGWRLFLRETLFRRTLGLIRAAKPSGHKTAAPQTVRGRYKAIDQTPKDHHVTTGN